MRTTLLGQRIKREREKLGLSREELGRLCGKLTAQAVCHIEIGKSKSPRNHRHFIQVLGISPKEYIRLFMQDKYAKLMDNLDIEDYEMPRITLKGDLDNAL